MANQHGPVAHFTEIAVVWPSARPAPSRSGARVATISWCPSVALARDSVVATVALIESSSFSLHDNYKMTMQVDYTRTVAREPTAPTESDIRALVNFNAPGPLLVQNLERQLVQYTRGDMIDTIAAAVYLMHGSKYRSMMTRFKGLNDDELRQVYRALLFKARECYPQATETNLRELCLTLASQVPQLAIEGPTPFIVNDRQLVVAPSSELALFTPSVQLMHADLLHRTMAQNQALVPYVVQQYELMAANHQQSLALVDGLSNAMAERYGAFIHSIVQMGGLQQQLNAELANENNELVLRLQQVVQHAYEFKVNAVQDAAAAVIDAHGNRVVDAVAVREQANAMHEAAINKEIAVRADAANMVVAVQENAANQQIAVQQQAVEAVSAAQQALVAAEQEKAAIQIAAIKDKAAVEAQNAAMMVAGQALEQQVANMDAAGNSLLAELAQVKAHLAASEEERLFLAGQLKAFEVDYNSERERCKRIESLRKEAELEGIKLRAELQEMYALSTVKFEPVAAGKEAGGGLLDWVFPPAADVALPVDLKQDLAEIGTAKTIAFTPIVAKPVVAAAAVAPPTFAIAPVAASPVVAAPLTKAPSKHMQEKAKAQAIASAHWAAHPRAEAADRARKAKTVVTNAADYIPGRNDFRGVDTAKKR